MDFFIYKTQFCYSTMSIFRLKFFYSFSNFEEKQKQNLLYTSLNSVPITVKVHCFLNMLEDDYIFHN